MVTLPAPGEGEGKTMPLPPTTIPRARAHDAMRMGTPSHTGSTNPTPNPPLQGRDTAPMSSTAPREAGTALPSPGCSKKPPGWRAMVCAEVAASSSAVVGFSLQEPGLVPACGAKDSKRRRGRGREKNPAGERLMERRGRNKLGRRDRGSRTAHQK